MVIGLLGIGGVVIGILVISLLGIGGVVIQWKNKSPIYHSTNRQSTNHQYTNH
jgi:hypothetical protein